MQIELKFIKTSQQRLIFDFSKSITFRQGAGTRVGQTESIDVSKLIQMSIK